MSDARDFATSISEEERRNGGLRCPHCKCIGHRRSSFEITATHRVIFYHCSNPLCGHSWRASLSYEYGLSPSAIPDPRVDLPMRPVDRSDALAAIAGAGRSDPDQLSMFGRETDGEGPGKAGAC